MEFSYVVNPNDPNDYWYNMTLYETEEYNFNINYNEALNSTMLWVNAVVRYNGKPIGMVGTGIPLQNFIDTMYKGLSDHTTMYLFNDKDEITGALDANILKDKLNIYDTLPFLKTVDAKPKEMVNISTYEGEYLLAPIEFVKWHMAYFIPYDFQARVHNAIVPGIVSLLIIFLILILVLTIIRIITQLNTLKNAIADLSSENADLQ